MSAARPIASPDSGPPISLANKACSCCDGADRRPATASILTEGNTARSRHRWLRQRQGDVSTSSQGFGRHRAVKLLGGFDDDDAGKGLQPAPADSFPAGCGTEPGAPAQGWEEQRPLDPQGCEGMLPQQAGRLTGGQWLAETKRRLLPMRPGAARI